MKPTAGQNGPLFAKKKLWTECTEKEQAFILQFIDHGNFLRAYEEAGYSTTNRRSATSNARQMFMRLRDTIYDQIAVRIGSHVPMALNVYTEILKEGSKASLSLKQKTAQDILDRSGFKEAQEIVITDIRTPDNMASQEIDSEVVALIKQLGLLDKAKEIDSDG